MNLTKFGIYENEGRAWVKVYFCIVLEVKFAELINSINKIAGTGTTLLRSRLLKHFRDGSPMRGNEVESQNKALGHSLAT